MKTTKRLNVQMTIETPSVPNFLRQENGQMVPLCALSDEGLEELGRAWIECLKARAKEQSKDADFFYKNASKA